MMAPSGSYRIPRSDLPRPRSETERFAVLEYGSPSLSWMKASAAAPRTQRPGRLQAFLARFRARSAARAARPAPLQPGIAAVHFLGATGRTEAAARPPKPAPNLREDLHPTLAVLRSVEPAVGEELCDCEP